MTRRRLLVAAALALLVVVALVVRTASRQSPRYNVLLITLDTTRADRLGCYGYAGALTPALDGLAARGVLFDQAFCNVPLTLPSHATMLTGLLPPEHGLRVNGGGRLSDNLPTVAEAFRDQGYATGAFIAAFALDSAFGLDRGFDLYDDDMSEAYEGGRENRFSVYRAGNLVADAALKWLGQDSPKPFFCWVHFYDPHWPDYTHAALDGTRFEGQATYNSEVAFMDVQVGRLLAFLDERGLRSRTLVIAVGDHGEGLDDHGEAEHGYLLYETTLRVPMICSLPGRIAQGRRVGAIVSLIDLYPTLHEFLGDENPPARAGRSLVPALGGEQIDSMPCYSETDLPYAYFRWCPLRSLTTPEFKYIHTVRPELYDRRQDPGELTDLARARPEVVEEMQAALSDIEKQMVLGQTDAIQLAPGQVRQLQGIGYFAVRAGNVDTATLDLSSLKDVKDMRVVLGMFVKLRRLLDEGKPEEAVRIGRQMVQLDPDSDGIHCNFADALVETGNLKEAETHYREALRINPEHSQAHCNYGLLLWRDRRPAEAIPHLEQAIRLNPGNVEAHDNLGCIDIEMDRLPEAVALFRKSIELDPASAYAHCKLGIAFEKQNQLAEALAQYQEALRIDPDFSEALYNVGNHLARQGQLDQAIEQYRHALTSWPDYAEVHHNLALVLLKKGDAGQAVEHLLEAVRLNADYASARNALTAIFLQQGQVARAVEQLRALHKLQPDDLPTLLRLAHILATCDDDTIRNGAQALELAQQACKKTDGKDPAALDVLGAAQAALGQFDQAKQAAATAVRLAREAGNDQLAQVIQAHLDLYQQGKPLRQTFGPAKP